MAINDRFFVDLFSTLSIIYFSLGMWFFLVKSSFEKRFSHPLPISAPAHHRQRWVNTDSVNFLKFNEKLIVHYVITH
jgi:hypothetical protein